MKCHYLQIKTILSCLLLSASICAEPLRLPENHSVNGGITIIPVDMQSKPQVRYNDKDVAVIPSPNANQWLLIVGIPLDEKKALPNLIVDSPRSGVVPFHVSQKFYRTQKLSIPNQRKVDPYAKDRARINAETKELSSIYAQRSSRNPFAEGFIAPSHGPISSLFGLKRVYNNKPRAPHSGLDVAAADKSRVVATNSGTVVSAKDYFFTGNTVIIDHGKGLFSLYAHLSSMNVSKGDKVNQGAVIGKIGATGRVTGPHLHWSMILNETLVDPLLFVSARDIRNARKTKP